MTALADIRISSGVSLGRTDAGRRLRVFARLMRCTTPTQVLYAGVDEDPPWRLSVYGGHPLLDLPTHPTYGEALALLAESAEAYATLDTLPLRTGGSSPERVETLAQIVDQLAGPLHTMNPSLWEVLQDLGDEIAIDVHEACAAFADPDVWYAGVDEGIEPVPDEHVALVIAALQRELNRETRYPDGSGFSFGGEKLPPAPLALLPWRVQRALAERRRLRYAQWGLGRAEWESGHWSLWNVPDDPDWLPRVVG